MNNGQLVDQFRASELPRDLAARVEELIDAVNCLRSTYPPEFIYRINFAERVVLRELMAPDDHDSHWWPTGLHIIREAVAERPSLEARFTTSLQSLQARITARMKPGTDVSLQQINSRTVTGICLLSELVSYPQNTFVAPNAYSLAEALFHPHAWYRAIYVGNSPAGFVMLDDDDTKPEYFLWRLMIAPHFQRRGIGARAMEQVVNYVRTRPEATELLLSYIDHEQGPANFYRGLGFVETGDTVDGEVIMRLDLTS